MSLGKILALAKECVYKVLLAFVAG